MSDTSSTTTVRFTGADLWAPDWVARVHDHLRRGTGVGFHFANDGSVPWFVLKLLGDAVFVLDSAGNHLGTFGSVEAAVSRGWAKGGWDDAGEPGR